VFQGTLPECGLLNFALHVKQPTLTVNGRYDYSLPAETSQVRLFRTLASRRNCRHHGHELNIRVQWQAGHVENGFGDVP
jgi:hypothetical protein